MAGPRSARLQLRECGLSTESNKVSIIITQNSNSTNRPSSAFISPFVCHNLCLICILQQKMEQSSSRYYFRKRDYLKIRNWYEMSKNNFVPEDTQLSKKLDKCREWHFKFQFSEIELTEEYAHATLKNIARVKQIVLLTSIFQRSSGCVVAFGRELSREGEFVLNSYSIRLKEDVVVYFYIEDVTSRDYEFCLDLQLITKDGDFLKLASCRYSLNQNKDTVKNKFLLSAHHQQQFDIDEAQTNKSKTTKKEPQKVLFDVGFIEIQQEMQQIKDISKYLPQLKIIDQQSKLPPSINFNIKKKKQQMVIEPAYKITLQALLIKISNPPELKRQILSNNPFTMSHKQLVQLQIKEYTITLDMHNGWKFMNQNKNILLMELVIQNEQEIYISSKQTEKLNLSYYDHESTLFIIILACKVDFRIKESTQRRTSEFIIGWLPLPVDLALKQNKIEMFFVNDHPFPATLLPQLTVQSTFTANFIHPLFQKYKPKQDDRRVLMNDLPIGQSEANEPNKVIKLVNSKKLGGQITSSTEMVQREEQIEAEIQTLRSIILKNQQEYQRNRLAIITGRTDKGEEKVNQPCHLSMEQCVGRVLKVKIQLKSLIPQTQVPSLYFLPRKIEGNIYFLRQQYGLKFHINQNQVKYHIPVSLNCNKSSISFKASIESVQQFDVIVNSRLVITLHEQNSSIMYCKGAISIVELLGQARMENVAYLRLTTWTQQGQRCFGTLLVNSCYELQKVKENYRKVEQFELQKEIQRLPMQQRLKMRIGNFKGDNEIKSQAVSMLKQKRHIQFVSNVVESELMSDGQMFYQLGFDSYYLLAFTNEDKSENNIFTFHLNCPYAELVTNEQDYRNVAASLNVQLQNYKVLQFVIKDRTQSYYQTTLQFNQSIGLLIRLNVNELKPGFSLKKIDLVIKRNTLQAKRFLIKCTIKQPLIWEALQCHDLLQSQDNGEMRMQVIDEVSSKYKDIAVLNQNIKYDYRNKEIVFSKRGLSSYQLLCIVTPNYSKVKKAILMKVMLWPGVSTQIVAGQQVKPIINFQSKHPIQIIRSESKEVHIPSIVRFNLSSALPPENIYIQFLRPSRNHPILITTHELSGQRLWSYLIKVTAKLSSNSHRIELAQTENASFSIQCQNPYACKTKFTLFSSSRSLKLSEHEVQIAKYEYKSIVGRINQWNCMEPVLYIFMIDQRGNIIQTVQVVVAAKESIIYQNV